MLKTRARATYTDCRALPKKRSFYGLLSKLVGLGLLSALVDIPVVVQIEAGHMDIENIPFNVRKEMEVVATLFADKARQKRLDFVFLVQVRSIFCICSQARGQNDFLADSSFFLRMK